MFYVAPALEIMLQPQVNGKKLQPNSTVVLRFMAPLVAWAIAVVVVFGVSFTQLANLQGPLSSLNAAAHVTYRISRVRVRGEQPGDHSSQECFTAYSHDCDHSFQACFTAYRHAYMLQATATF